MTEQEQKPEQEKTPENEGQSISRSESMKLLIKAERLTQIAFVLPAAVLVGWGIGALLDMWLHTTWIYIVGLVLGAVAGMFEAVRQALRED